MSDLLSRALALLPGPACPGRVLTSTTIAEALGVAEVDVSAALHDEYHRVGTRVSFADGSESAGGRAVRGWRLA